MSESEVLTLAILSQWPRFRSERDFWRFANAYLSGYFPNVVGQSQLNRRIRALEPELRTLQRDLAGTLAEPSEAFHILDTTLQRCSQLLTWWLAADINGPQVRFCCQALLSVTYNDMLASCDGVN